MYLAQKDYKKTIEAYQNVLKLFPHNPEAYFYMGLVYAEQREFSKSEYFLQQALKQPQFVQAYKAYIYLGKMRMTRGKRFYLLAEKSFQKAIKKKPEKVEAILALNNLYTLQGKRQKALRLAEDFQKKYGPHLEMAQYLAENYLAIENFDKALKQLSFIEKVEPINVSVKFKIALIFVSQGEVLKAAKKLEQTVSSVS